MAFSEEMGGREALALWKKRVLQIHAARDQMLRDNKVPTCISVLDQAPITAFSNEARLIVGEKLDHRNKTPSYRAHTQHVNALRRIARV